jgi:hypothetical protein
MPDNCSVDLNLAGKCVLLFKIINKKYLLQGFLICGLFGKPSFVR